MKTTDEQIEWCCENFDAIDTAIAHFDEDEDWMNAALDNRLFIHAIIGSLQRLQEYDRIHAVPVEKNKPEKPGRLKQLKMFRDDKK